MSSELLPLIKEKDLTNESNIKCETVNTKLKKRE